jgi:hypothetical protein
LAGVTAETRECRDGDHRRKVARAWPQVNRTMPIGPFGVAAQAASHAIIID